MENSFRFTEVFLLSYIQCTVCVSLCNLLATACSASRKSMYRSSSSKLHLLAKISRYCLFHRMSTRILYSSGKIIKRGSRFLCITHNLSVRMQRQKNKEVTGAVRLEQLCQRFPLGSQFASEHGFQSAVPRFYLDHSWIWQG